MFSAKALLAALPVEADREREGMGEVAPPSVARRDPPPSSDVTGLLPCKVNDARRLVAGSPSSRSFDGVDDRDDWLDLRPLEDRGERGERGDRGE